MIGWLRIMLSKLRPPWISWEGLYLLAVQSIIACFVVYVTLGNLVGFLKPMPGVNPPQPHVLMLIMVISVCAIVIALGIYRNQWWAYIAELALIWFLTYLYVQKLGVRASTPSPPGLRLPYQDEMLAFMCAVAYLHLNWTLIHRGVQGFKELRNRRKQYS